MTDYPDRLARLEAKVDDILSLLRETHTNARRMGSHIDTVETVIDQFQRPAYFVKHYIERFLMRGGDGNAIESDSEKISSEGKLPGAPIDFSPPEEQIGTRTYRGDPSATVSGI